MIEHDNIRENVALLLSVYTHQDIACIRRSAPCPPILLSAVNLERHGRGSLTLLQRETSDGGGGDHLFLHAGDEGEEGEPGSHGKEGE